MLAVRGSVGALVVGALVTATLVLGTEVSTYANPWGDVNCEQEPDHPVCDVEAGSSGGVMVAGLGGEVVCHLDGEVVPCVTDDGWLGSDGCRYLRLDDAPPPSDVTEAGAAYRVRCPGDLANSRRPLVWLSDVEAPGPAELGRVAASRLVLPRPEVVVNPPASAPQLVMLPTWLWVEPGWWVSRSASASVPGVTVTARASPVRVVWSMGDGTSVTCEGPGTPYTAEVGGPAAASPDCGHIYRRTSADRPGGVFEVSATVTWQVSWSGGGFSGSAGPLFSTATVPVTVAEVRSVNTGGGL